MSYIKAGLSTDLPIERHSVDHFVRMKEIDGKGWRGQPMEIWGELKEIKSWIVPSLEIAKSLEKRAKIRFRQYDLFPERVGKDRVVNGASEIFYKDERALSLFIKQLDKEYPGVFPKVSLKFYEAPRWFYLLEVKRRPQPLELPPALQNPRYGYQK